jgi:hypothetical protein
LPFLRGGDPVPSRKFRIRLVTEDFLPLTSIPCSLQYSWRSDKLYKLDKSAPVIPALMWLCKKGKSSVPTAQLMRLLYEL